MHGRRIAFSTARLAGLFLGLVAASAGEAQTGPEIAETRAYSGLHLAAWQGDAVALARAINAGGDVDAVDGNGRTALHVAAFASHEQLFSPLVKAGADPDALDLDRYDIITIAAVANDIDALEQAIAAGGNVASVTSVYDGTALIAAAHLGHYRCVEILLAAGAPVDHVNNLHWTALIEAVVLGDGGPDHQRTVAALLAAGADTALADRQGKSPLEHARSRGFGEIVVQIEAAAGGGT